MHSSNSGAVSALGPPKQRREEQHLSKTTAATASPPKAPEPAPVLTPSAQAAQALNSQAGMMKVVALLQELLTLTSERMQVRVTSGAVKTCC
jgi:hypothetical protein